MSLPAQLPSGSGSPTDDGNHHEFSEIITSEHHHSPTTPLVNTAGNGTTSSSYRPGSANSSTTPRRRRIKQLAPLIIEKPDISNEIHLIRFGNSSNEDHPTFENSPVNPKFFSADNPKTFSPTFFSTVPSFGEVPDDFIVEDETSIDREQFDSVDFFSNYNYEDEDIAMKRDYSTSSFKEKSTTKNLDGDQIQNSSSYNSASADCKQPLTTSRDGDTITSSFNIRAMQFLTNCKNKAIGLWSQLYDKMETIMVHTGIAKLYIMILKRLSHPTIATFIFLTTLGCFGAMYGILVEFLIEQVILLRVMLASSTPYLYLNYLFWIIFCLFFSILATACVHFISPHSSGLGICEMKSILSGIVMNRYLSIRTLVSKTIGIIFVFAADLSVGKEGPFCQILSCIAHNILRLRLFEKLQRNDFQRNNMLAIAAAVGITISFGTPCGALLFSVEVTTTHYPTNNLWKGIYCTLLTTFFLNLFKDYKIHISLLSTDFEPLPYSAKEYVLFALLGICCGLLAAFFNQMVERFVKFRKSMTLVRSSRYLLVIVVTLFTSALTFGFPLLKMGNDNFINLLFSEASLTSQVPNVVPSLLFLTILKLMLTGIAIVLPIPCGVFTPLFVAGASFGRCFGEVSHLLFLGAIPAGYAVVGAAALSAAATRTISTVVILFELTGQLSYLVPVMVSTVFAIGVGNFFNSSIYDTIIRLRGLPYLPTAAVTGKHLGKLTAREIMRTNIDFLSTYTLIPHIKYLLKTTSHEVYPLVNNENDRLLIGSVLRTNLEILVEKYEHLKLFESPHSNSFEEVEKPQFIISNMSHPKTHEEDPELKDVSIIETPIISVTTPQANKDSPRTPVKEDEVMFEEVPTLDEKEVNLSLSPLHYEQDEIPEVFPNDSNHFSGIDVSNIIEGSVTNPNTTLHQHSELMIEYDPAPFQISSLTRYYKLHFIFSMLGLSHAWIVTEGKLIGVVTKKDMIKLENK